VTQHTPTRYSSRAASCSRIPTSRAVGLDLSAALLDGDPRNGELHPDGVTLIGGRELKIAVLARAATRTIRRAC